ncbi:hypothetical protein ACTQXV_01320 [Ligilactobacillus salivarius]|uniref:hypothetical protein n=1 Tax=Ligilactobacillus salivarius TaxID=1624 RepID=UPI00399402D5
MRIINRIAYFLDNFVTFFIIYSGFIGTSLLIFHLAYNKVALEVNLTILYFVALSVCFISFSIYWIADGIVNADLKKSITRTEYQVTAYENKNLLLNYPEENYYLIKMENETKVVRKDLVFLNKQDKFADGEHKAGTTDIKYIEIKLDDSLPAYKREIFNQKTKYKNRLNVINYVSTEV